jgi:hypothetical protein
LQTHLQETNLVHSSKLGSLQGLKIGLDAAFWLRSIQKLKDPFADALGGVPPGLFGMLDRELEQFKKHKITPVFVFEGIVPPLQSQAFQLSAIHMQLDAAWTHIAKDARHEAQKVFAVSTSRINADIEHIVFHHLKAQGIEVMRAPYFVGAQLMHLAETGFVQAVVGAPGMLLYGVPKVILLLDFARSSFEWTDLGRMLQSWSLSKDQFVDACLLAGTEYCLTYPYLNIDDHQQHGHFQFEFAIDFIKCMPLANWMQVFPQEEMRMDHIHGYCVSKVLLQNTPVLHTKTMKVRPVGDSCPRDFATLIGSRLPAKLYMLLCSGVVSRSLPAAVACGKWVDREPPLIDSQEYRQLLVDLRDYRARALGLMLQWAGPDWIRKDAITYEVYWDRNGSKEPDQQNQKKPEIRKTLRWSFAPGELAAEKKRQNVQNVDIGFCLRMHAKWESENGDLTDKFGSIEPKGPARPKGEIPDIETAMAMTHLLLLESLELIGEGGDMTVLGDVLKDCPEDVQESCLFALELMKFGVLTEQPFEEAPDRQFPQAVQYPKAHANDYDKAVFLISRIMSLRPMRVLNSMWDAYVDFDLAAFHSHVRILMRTLRELTEACLCNIVLQDFSLVGKLPPHLLNPSDPSKSSKDEKPLLPTFMLPRNCMGVVWKTVLTMKAETLTGTLHEELTKKFPCCADPVADLRASMKYWEEVYRCVSTIAEPLGALDIKACMDSANIILKQKCQAFGI